MAELKTKSRKRARNPGTTPQVADEFHTVAYIGTKRKIADAILDVLDSVWPDARTHAFHDAFAGAGGMAFYASKRYASVVCNDQELYSYAVLRAMSIAAQGAPLVDWDAVTSAEGDGYVEQELCVQRRFFRPENGRVIDAVRAWLRTSDACERTKAYVLGALLLAASRVSNTTGVYGAYLKTWCRRAKNNIHMGHAVVGISKCTAARGFADDAARRAQPQDVVYCDPPYTVRSYSKNYHVLNIIADVSQNVALAGISGLPAITDDTYNLPSAWNKRAEAPKALLEMLQATTAHRMVLSYSTDGLMTMEKVQEVFCNAGWRGNVYRMPYRRYWGGQEDGQKNTSELCELLFVYERVQEAQPVFMEAHGHTQMQ
jgi:adenine-specific DNA-methyltransferase